MKFLIVARHADYDKNNDVSPLGLEQMEKMIEALAAFVNGKKVLLLSSNAPRAYKCAKMISEKFKISFEEHKELWAKDRLEVDVDRLFELLQSKKGDFEIIILMTHLEYVEEFPAHFAHNVLSMDMSSEWPPIPLKGEACVVDCLNKSFQIIPARN